MQRKEGKEEGERKKGGNECSDWVGGMFDAERYRERENY